jgi:hypothetical protein
MLVMLLDGGDLEASSGDVEAADVKSTVSLAFESLRFSCRLTVLVAGGGMDMPVLSTLAPLELGSGARAFLLVLVLDEALDRLWAVWREDAPIDFPDSRLRVRCKGSMSQLRAFVPSLDRGLTKQFLAN